MKLDRVTITGADNSIKPRDLIPLSLEFPWVEWGILFSPSKQNQSRYPTRDWVEELMEVAPEGKMQLSGHLCGGWVRNLVEGNYDFGTHYGELAVSYLNRIQLNMTDSTFKKLDLRSVQNLVKMQPPNVIIQTKTPFERSDELKACNEACFGPMLQMLYDVSGGHGVTPKSWCPPVEGLYCGYAGGLGPDNLEKQLVKIDEAVGDHIVWIDMESRVRLDLDDSFSLNRVRRVLEIAAPWVNKE